MKNSACSVAEQILTHTCKGVFYNFVCATEL